MGTRNRVIALGAIGALAVAGMASPALAAKPKTINVVTTKKAMLKYTGIPAKLAAGTYVFRYTNTSGMDHNLKVGSVSTPVFAKGTKSITVKLKKGKVAYICTVPGHAAAGMKGTIKVT